MILNNWYDEPVKVLDDAMIIQAGQRQTELTKPPGSLGQLEVMAVRLASMQSRPDPAIDKAWISVFAADHGVTAEGVSAFPQAVTVEMIRNFARGGAAISVLAREVSAQLEVIDAGSAADTGDIEGIIREPVAAGTANLAREAAMTPAQLAAAMEIGRQAVDRAVAQGADMFIAGDMGIGNTTSAAAVACALLDLAGVQMAGPGTGLEADAVRRKADIIDRALDLHQPDRLQPLEVLRCLGGFEIAAISAAAVRCAQSGLPMLVDGFIAGASVLAAVRYQARVFDWLIFGHCSAEPGHRYILDAMQAEPLLELGMRLGEGSGAAAALPLIRLACALHNDMATFAEAGVSGKES
jgi:nicotinate-nucleotide--dimethylbenzimidazole phosphoribosyltransferase